MLRGKWKSFGFHLSRFETARFFSLLVISPPLQPPRAQSPNPNSFAPNWGLFVTGFVLRRRHPRRAFRHASGGSLVRSRLRSKIPASLAQTSSGWGIV